MCLPISLWKILLFWLCNGFLCYIFGIFCNLNPNLCAFVLAYLFFVLWCKNFLPIIIKLSEIDQLSICSLQNISLSGILNTRHEVFNCMFPTVFGFCRTYKINIKFASILFGLKFKIDLEFISLEASYHDPWLNQP